MRSRFATYGIRYGIERGGLLVLVVLVTYIALAPTTVVDGDNAELATLGALGGRAHPSGYPAYVLYLRLVSWLPGQTPAHTAAIATAMLGTLVVLILHAACRAWGARPAAASLACAIYAASPVVLRMHTEAEVFALNGLVVALVLWLAATAGPLRGVARGAALGLVAGLGLANHLTCVLVAPVGILGVVRGMREQRTAIIAALAGLAVGLLPYLYLVTADGPVSYGRVDGLSDVIAFVTRRDYGGPGAFRSTAPALPAENLVAFAATLGRAWLWLPAVAGVAVLGLRSARVRIGETRVAWAMLGASFVIAGPLLVLRFNMLPTGIGLYVVQRFHLLPILLLAIPVAVACDRCTDRVRPAIAATLPIVGFVGLVAVAWPRLAAQHSPAVERFVVNTVRSLPPDAVALVGTDELCFGAPYIQDVLGERPDVEIVCAPALRLDWYRDRVVARGVPLRNGEVDLDAVLARRPVFVDENRRAPQHTVYPLGVLRRVLPPGTRAPALAAIVDENRRVYAVFDLHYARPERGDDWPAFVHRRYAGTWIELAVMLAAAGQRAAALEARAVALELYPSVLQEVDAPALP